MHKINKHCLNFDLHKIKKHCLIQLWPTLNFKMILFHLFFSLSNLLHDNLLSTVETCGADYINCLCILYSSTFCILRQCRFFWRLMNKQSASTGWVARIVEVSLCMIGLLCLTPFQVYNSRKFILSFFFTNIFKLMNYFHWRYCHSCTPVSTVSSFIELV